MELVHYHFSFTLLLYREITGQGPPASPHLAQGHLSWGRCLIAPADLLFLTVKVFTAVRRPSLLVLTRASFVLLHYDLHLLIKVAPPLQQAPEGQLYP